MWIRGRKAGCIVLLTALYMFLFPWLGQTLQDHAWDSQKMFCLYSWWALLYDPILGCMLAVCCGSLWNTVPTISLLAAELLCCVCALFPAGVIAAGGTLENIAVPDFYMCLLYAGAVAALFVRSLIGYLRRLGKG